MNSPWLASRLARGIISICIVLHLAAVFGEPMRMFTQGRQPSAPDAEVIRSGLGPYIDFAYLHHGYFFFAPNPGPSHLMDITLTDADGSLRQLRLPNRKAQWPRLLYHRHFMLSEFLHQLYTPPPAFEGESDPLARQQWQSDRQTFETVRASMEKHLAARYGAEKASIQLMEHRLPNAIEVFDRKLPLDDPSLYILLPDQPLASPEAADSRLDPASRSHAEPAPNRGSFGSQPSRGPEEIRP